MNRLVSIVGMSVVAVLCFAAPAAAQAGTTPSPLIEFSGAFSVGLTVLGAAFGIGKLASAAVESMSRQPEVAGNIQVAMIIAAALIEGFTFYALFICSQQNPFQLNHRLANGRDFDYPDERKVVPMLRWVIPACSWVGFLVLLCLVQVPARAADEKAESPAADPAKDVAHPEAAQEEQGDGPAEDAAAHGEQAEDAHAQAGGHAGTHHDPYDLGHQNGTDMLEDPSEFKSDLAIWTFVVFLCLLLLLLKFAWRPIMDGLEKREQSMADMIDEAKASADKAAEQLRQYEAKLEAAGNEAREVLAQAQRQAEGVKETIVAEAREAAQRERKRAVADIETAENAALQDITTRGVELAVTMAGRIVRRQLEPEDHAKLIREALDQLPSRN